MTSRAERLAQYRVSYDTPLRSLAKVLSVAWNNGERTIIGCVGGKPLSKRIVAILQPHCGLYKAHREAIDLSSVEAFEDTYAPILARTPDTSDTLRYGSAVAASPVYLGPAPRGARRAPGPARPQLPRRRARARPL